MDEEYMNRGCCEETMGRLFRAGDIVKHRQTGQTWELAVDEEDGKVMPNGWPESLADAKDCTLVTSGTDEARVENLESWAAKGKGYEHERDLRTSKARRQVRQNKPK